jgi:hypothetical protein
MHLKYRGTSEHRCSELRESRKYNVWQGSALSLTAQFKISIHVGMVTMQGLYRTAAWCHMPSTTALHYLITTMLTHLARADCAAEAAPSCFLILHKSLQINVRLQMHSENIGHIVRRPGKCGAEDITDCVDTL